MLYVMGGRYKDENGYVTRLIKDEDGRPHVFKECFGPIYQANKSRAYLFILNNDRRTANLFSAGVGIPGTTYAGTITLSDEDHEGVVKRIAEL